MAPSLETKQVDRVVLACVQCRSRHVKCDATQPVCNRCMRDGKECAYQKSRRGGLDKAALTRRRLRLQQQEAEQSQPSQQEDSQGHHQEQLPEITLCNVQTTQVDGTSPLHADQSQSDSMESYSPPSLDFDAMRIVEKQLTENNMIAFQVSQDRLIDMYYENFWPSFPFPLPKPYLNARRTNKNHGLDALILVLQWLGAVYAPWTPSEAYYEAAVSATRSSSLPRTPFSVQALLNLAIAQTHSDLKRDGRESLNMAISLALEMRMNEKEFAYAWGESNPVLEESWRRTYYILHLTDQHAAVIVNAPTFALREVPTLVDLPCDDEYYETGQIPAPSTWRDYDMREFAEVEIIYSSIVYFYDIGRVISFIMATFLEIGTISDSLISAVDAKVAAWQNLLPACKRDPMHANGKVDEIMFLTHMLAAVYDFHPVAPELTANVGTSIMLTLHRPFSSLSYSIEELSTQSFTSPVPFIEPLRQGRSAHTGRALKGIEIQTRLLAIPCAVERHNVFTMCIAASLATAQVSACNALLEDHASSIARDRIRLSIGFLNTMGTIWPLAKNMAKEVRYVARQTLKELPDSGVSRGVNPTAEIEIARDDLIWPVDPCANIDIYSGLTIPGDWDGSGFNYSSSSLGSNAPW